MLTYALHSAATLAAPFYDVKQGSTVLCAVCHEAGDFSAQGFCYACLLVTHWDCLEPDFGRLSPWKSPFYFCPECLICSD